MGGWIKQGIGALGVLLVGQDEGHGDLGVLLEWAKTGAVLLLMSSSERGWY